MIDRRWRASVEQGLEPVGRVLVRAGISADALTIFGLAAAVATAVLIANGNLVWAVFGLIATGIPDILDGSVARQSGTANERGAFFDSVFDRIADAVILGGVAWHLSTEGSQLSILVFAVLALTMLVSYERAKAEALGLSAQGGIMERLERFVLLGIGLALDILIPVLWIMLALTAITAAHRFVMVWRQATPKAVGKSSRSKRTPRARRPRRISRVSS